MESLSEELKGIDIRVDEPLKEYTYTKVGGSTDYLALPRNYYELAQIVTFANRNNIPWMVLGSTSNIIVYDGGIHDFVIVFDKLNIVTANGHVIEAETGASLIETACIVKFHSLTSLEFTCGIPGSVGDTVSTSAGAYGGKISHILASARVITKEGEIETIEARDMKFGYRHSAAQDGGDVVISAKFVLEPGGYVLVEQEMVRLTHLRELKQPLEYLSCSSASKCSVGHFAGRSISEANSRGHRIGGIEANKKHAGFTVNVADGNTQDYEDLTTHVTDTVKQNSGVRLECEVRIIGERKH